MASLKDRIKEILLRDKLISPKDLENAIEEQNRTGGELSKVLLRLNLISDHVFAQITSESLELPFITLARLKIDKNVLNLIPKEISNEYKVIPVSVAGDYLTLAMVDPLNLFVIDNVKSLTGLMITPIVSEKSDVEETIQKHYYVEDDVDTSDKLNEIIKDIKDSEDPELVKDLSDTADKSGIEEITDEAPIIKLTDAIIQQAAVARASDVFIEPMEKEIRVRYRIDGVIREIDRMAKALIFPIVSRIKVIANLDISEHRLPQDGRFKTKISGGRTVDYRVSVLPTVFGEKIVLRVLDQEGAAALDVEKLGFFPESLQKLKECAVKPHGMILTCGPTGSGKTTTLYSILKYVDSPEKNIVTVEDPVEYQMKGMNQVNIKPQVGLTFSSSLRSILRQDPDIIMIGEIRDAETLDIAVKAALTGHLVLSSLHTTTAAGSIIRMMNMGIEPFLISSSVLAIVAQRLLRRICSECKEKYEVSNEVVKKVGLDKMFKKDKIEMHRGKGCDTCFNTGYKGRVGITEVLILTPKIKELILTRAGEIKIKQESRREGMKTMREDALFKTIEGLTTLEEVLRVTAKDSDEE